MMDLKACAPNLSLKNGIWYSAAVSEINYPSEGNEVCMQLEDSSFWFRHRNNCLYALISKYSNNKPFFDIGGGNGFVSSNLEKHGLKTVLLEPGLSGCLNAQKRGLKNIVCAAIEDAGFAQASIPAAGIFDVLEHIEDDKSFLSKLNFYLRPGGELYITVPAYNFLWSGEDEYAGHFRRYTLRNLSSLLYASGFQIIFKTYIFSFLPLPIFLFRSIPSIFKFTRSRHGLEKYKKEHGTKQGAAVKISNKILAWELNRIENNKSVSFGASCLIASRKIK